MAFLFFYSRVPAALICWTMGQQAFNSCMILILDALETGDLSRIWKVEKAYAVFVELDKNGVHKLANLAVEKVSWGINELKLMQAQDDAGTGGRAQTATLGRIDQTIDIKMQGAAGSEATPCSGIVHDTVMGNTGMLLLEDPGLQSFVPEAFSPFTWVMAGNELGNVSPTQLKHQEQEQQKYSEQVPREKHDSDMLRQRACDPQSARSSEELRGVQGSALGSAPMRYATFSTAPSQDHVQPQGLTSPTSPPTSTTVMQEHHHVQGISTSLHQAPPPHLRHHSYPSLQQHVPTPPAPHPPRSSLIRRYGEPLSGREGQAAAAYTTTTSSPRPAQAPLQTLPETSSQPLYDTNNPRVQPRWAARPAPLISSMSEPALNFSHVSAPSPGIPVIAEQAAQQDARPAYQYTFPFHMSTAGHEGRTSVAAVAGMTTEQMEVERWRRWVGSSGAG